MNKLKLSLALMCDSTIIDSSNKVSAIGIFNQILSPKFPSIHPDLSILLIWENSNGNYKQQIKIVNPNNEVIFKTGWLDLTVKDLRAQGVYRILQLELAKEGIYKVQIYLNDDETLAGELNLIARLKTQDQ